MLVEGIIEELRANGSASIKKTLLNHGAREPFFGVKIEYLKKIEKRIKTDYQLALDLYGTGISDAMYLAGLIADDMKMTRDDLQRWVEAAYWSLLSENTVPWVAAGGRFGRECALEWIESDVETIAAAGWATYSGLISVKPNTDLDLSEVRSLLKRAATTIHTQPNRVRYIMNGFVIGVGGYAGPLAYTAMETALTIGPISIDMGNTACRAPYAPEAIKKTWDKHGGSAPKRKKLKC